MTAPPPLGGARRCLPEVVRQLRAAGSNVLAVARGEERLTELAAESGGSLGEVALAVARLERDGWLRETAGWFEAIDEWADLA